MAVLDTDDAATIEAAIDSWIDEQNRDIERHLRREAGEVASYGNEKRAKELHAEAEQIRVKARALIAARKAA